MSMQEISNQIFKVTPQGVITIDKSKVKDAFINAYREIFGADIKTEFTDPIGQIIAGDVAIIEHAQNEIVKVANNFSVYYATGAALDIAASFWGYYRRGARQSIVKCVISGKSGVTIKSGARVANSDGVEFKLLDDVTIGSDGKVTAAFASVKPGEIEVLKNTVTKILTPQPGFDSINNLTPGIIGVDCEDDNNFRRRIIENQLNIRGSSLLGSVIDNIAGIEGVLSVKGLENTDEKSQTIEGVLMKPHSIFLSIHGGEAAKIAEVITKIKPVGCAMNGEQPVFYFDKTTGYNYKYLIHRPEVVPIEVEIEYKDNRFTTPDTVNHLKEFANEVIKNNPYGIGATVAGADFGFQIGSFKLADILSIKLRIGENPWRDWIETTIKQIPVVCGVSLKKIN